MCELKDHEVCVTEADNRLCRSVEPVESHHLLHFFPYLHLRVDVNDRLIAEEIVTTFVTKLVVMSLVTVGIRFLYVRHEVDLRTLKLSCREAVLPYAHQFPYRLAESLKVFVLLWSDVEGESTLGVGEEILADTDSRTEIATFGFL